MYVVCVCACMHMHGFMHVHLPVRTHLEVRGQVVCLLLLSTLSSVALFQLPLLATKLMDSICFPHPEYWCYKDKLTGDLTENPLPIEPPPQALLLLLF